MGLSQDIRDQAARYLRREVSLEEFEDWLASETWNVHESGDPDAAALAYSIELLLSEYGAGDRSLDELREGLRSHVELVQISYVVSSVTQRTELSTQSQRVRWPLVAAGR